MKKANKLLSVLLVFVLFSGTKLVGEYTLIIKGDLNGDSVCDVLDAMLTEQISNGHQYARQNQIFAANGCISEEIDAASYQNVVNISLTS